MPPVALAAVAAGTTLAGGIAGAIERSNANAEAKELMKKRLAELEAAGTPPNTALPLILQEFKLQGVITPELEQQIHVEASKVAQIQEDPKLRQAAMQGLQLLQQRSDQGFGAEEEAAFSDARKATGKEAQGRLQSIIQQAQARGMGGSGMELAAQLSSSQAADQQLSDEGLKIAAEKARAQKEAIVQMLGAANQMRGQDFDIAKGKASAEDELNRFKVGLTAEQQARNVATQNIAQRENLAAKQKVADLNVQQGNAEQLRQSEAAANDWRNKVSLAQAKGGIYGDQANQAIKQGDAAATGWANIGQGVASSVTGIGALGVGGAKGIGNVPAAAPAVAAPVSVMPATPNPFDLDDYLGRKKQ